MKISIESWKWARMKWWKWLKVKWWKEINRKLTNQKAQCQMSQLQTRWEDTSEKSFNNGLQIPSNLWPLHPNASQDAKMRRTCAASLSPWRTLRRRSPSMTATACQIVSILSKILWISTIDILLIRAVTNTIKRLMTGKNHRQTILYPLERHLLHSERLCGDEHSAFKKV